MKPTYLLLFLFCASIFLTACDPDDDIIINTAQEEADRIRANTPTELPPITTTGENTMGAWIIPRQGSALALAAGTDSILFVASGVERIDPIGSSSTDCNAFQNYRYESQGYVNIRGYWCERPEIGDSKALTIAFRLFDEGWARVSCGTDLNGGRDTDELKFRSDTLRPPQYEIQTNDSTGRILSATFSAELIGWYNTSDTIKVTNGRLDATYGSTP